MFVNEASGPRGLPGPVFAHELAVLNFYTLDKALLAIS